MQTGGGFQVSRCSLSHTSAVSHQQFDKFNWARKALLQDDELQEKAGKICGHCNAPSIDGRAYTLTTCADLRFIAQKPPYQCSIPVPWLRLRSPGFPLRSRRDWCPHLRPER